MTDKTDTDRGLKALEAYLKDCDDHAIVPDVGGAFHAAFMAGRASTGFTAADMATASAQGFRDGVASLSAAEPADHVALEAAMRAIQQAIALIGETADERMRAVRRVLRGAVIVAEDSAAIPALKPVAASGWRSVPVTLTDDMKHAASINNIDVETLVAMWQYLLATAPAAPTLTQGATIAAGAVCVELSEPEIVRIYERYGGDMINCTRAIERAVRASHGQAPAQPEVAPAAGGWREGVEAAAKLLVKKADDFAKENGHEDMGSLSFGRGSKADAKLDYHSSLLELAEEVRSMAATTSPQAAQQAPAQPISLQPVHDAVTIELLNERVAYLEAKLAQQAPSTPASGGWISIKDQLPPCRDDQDYIGINSAGFAGIFNAIADIAGNVYCMMETGEESVSIMSDLSIWKPFTRPLPASPTIEGESNG